MTITVKILPPDGSWQSACELIKRIAANNPGGELNFIVEDVFNTGSKAENPIVMYGNKHANAVGTGTIQVNHNVR